MQSIALGKRLNSLVTNVLTGFLIFPAAINVHAAMPPAARLAAIAVPFVANDGQVDDRVAFYARTFAGNVFVTSDGRLVYAFAKGHPQRLETPASTTSPTIGWTLAESFAGISTNG